MSNYATFHKRIENLSIAIEQRNQRHNPVSLSLTVLCDPTTMQALPGHEPTQESLRFKHVKPGKRGGIWLPKKVYLLAPGETLEDGIDP